MRFRTASFSNFKLLRDVELGFSTDSARPLTVIRAENASGKTSMLIGLRWALYGNKGLDDASIRLSPMDWPSGELCEVKVELDFEHTTYSSVGTETVATTEGYRLVRNVVEEVGDDTFVRQPDHVALFRLGEDGAESVPNAELAILEMLPVELEDVFFTDGDAAMSFISPQLTRGNRRDQVKGAIKSLLGLGLLEAARTHVREVQRRLTKAAGTKSTSTELSDVADQLQGVQERLEKAREVESDVKAQVELLGRQHAEADRQLQDALQVANYDELAARRETARKRKATATGQITALKSVHRSVLESESLSWSLVDDKLMAGYEKLAELHDAGVIPKTAVPVLEDRLALGVCICGADLSPGTPANHAVADLIAGQRSIDDERERLTHLYHTARNAVEEHEADAHDWSSAYRSVAKNRIEMNKLFEEADADEKYCDDRIKGIQQSEIEEKRQHRDSLSSALREKEDNRRDLQIAIATDERRSTSLDTQFKELSKRDRRLRTINARRDATSDVAKVIDETFDVISDVYVARVSDRMNGLFLDMVGADPDQGTIVSGASISDEYDIVVHSVDGRVLHPDHELNGASKRALTFSFIWALTEVSGTIAPRVIDTPLGMMSGPVKRRVLELVSRPPADDDRPELQVILFLTRSEIAQTEDLIDDRAGSVMTLTNTDHFPTDLANDPEVERTEVLVCECNHRQACQTCQRTDDDQFDLAFRGS